MGKRLFLSGEVEAGFLVFEEGEDAETDREQRNEGADAFQDQMDAFLLDDGLHQGEGDRRDDKSHADEHRDVPSLRATADEQAGGEGQESEDAEDEPREI